MKKLWWLAGIMFLLASCSSALSTPAPAATQPSPVPIVTAYPALTEPRQIVLEWPHTLREQDGDVISLTLAMDDQGNVTITPDEAGHTVEGTPVEIPNLYETHNIVAAARLDMAGMDSWREEIREPLRPGKAARFRWSIHANESGIYRGVVWLDVDLIPKTGGESIRVPLLAKPITVEVITVIGLPGWLARVVGGAGVALSAVLGYPFVQQILARLRLPRGMKPERTAAR